MVGQVKALAAGDFHLQALDGRILEFLHAAALNTDDVIVVITTVEFEHRVAALEMVTDHEPRRFELGQHPIDRSQADFLALGDEALEDLLRTQMAVGG